MSWYGGDRSLESWCNEYFGVGHRDAGEPSVEAKAQARAEHRKRLVEDFIAYCQGDTLISPAEAEKLRTWPTTNGGILGVVR